jgi:hypothetical protein
MAVQPAGLAIYRIELSFAVLSLSEEERGAEEKGDSIR